MMVREYMQEAAARPDPARVFESGEWWFTTWKYRFLPKSYLAADSAAVCDEGLDRLVYFQSLITEDDDRQ